MDNEWLVLIVRTNIRRLKGFVGLDSLRRTRAINSQTRAELMFLLFRSRRELHKLWQFSPKLSMRNGTCWNFCSLTQTVSILCVNTKRCFKLCSYTPLGIQMRLKIWLLIWIRPGPGFVPPQLLFSIYWESRHQRISVVCALKVSSNNSEDVAIYFAACPSPQRSASCEDLSYFQVLLTWVICKQFGIIIPC